MARTPKDSQDVLRQLVAEGLTQIEMAERLGTSSQNLQQRLRRLGLQPSKKPRRRTSSAPKKVRVWAWVPEEVAGWLQPGQAAEILEKAWKTSTTL